MLIILIFLFQIIVINSKILSDDYDLIIITDIHVPDEQYHSDDNIKIHRDEPQYDFDENYDNANDVVSSGDGLKDKLYIDENDNGKNIISKIQELEDELYIGENIKFLCFANGTSTETRNIKWNVDIWDTIKSNSNFIESEFLIRNITKNYETEYECTITEGTRTIFISRLIHLKDPPESYLNISGQNLEKIIREEGENINMIAIAEGFPKQINTKFVWQPFIMPNETKSISQSNIRSKEPENLSFFNISLFDSGNYTFIAENKFGKRNKTFEVFVKGLEIVLNLTQKNNYIKFSETRQISCAATSYPKINIFDWHIVPCNWEKAPHYKCIDKYRENLESTIIDYNEPSLSYSNILNYINNIDFLFVHNFSFWLITCTAYNDYKNKNISAKLYFGEYDKPIVSFFNDEKLNHTVIGDTSVTKTVEVGENFNITCEGLKAKYMQKIEWCKDSYWISDVSPPFRTIASNVKVVNSFTRLMYRSTLIFSNAKHQLNGVYACRFWTRSDNTSEMGSHVYLWIIEPSKNYLNISGSNLEKIIREEGENLDLKAIAQGHPRQISTKFLWHQFTLPHETKVMHQSNITSKALEKLSLFHISLFDSGNYTFIAENKYGKRNKTFEVYVKGLEIVLNLTQKNDYIKFGETRQISCAAISYPKINKFEWHIVPCKWEKEPHFKCIDKYRQNLESTIINYDEPSLSYSNILNYTNNIDFSFLHDFSFGLITCSAYNNYKNKNSSAKLYFGEYDKPIVAFINDEIINHTISEITQISIEVGKQLNFTCEALKSKYTQKIEWCKALNVISADCPPISTIGIDIEQSSTNLIYRSTLKLSEVKMEHNGLYKCVFWTISNNETETFTVVNLIIYKSFSEWLYAIISVLLIILLILGYFYIKYLKMRSNLKKLGLHNFLKGKPNLINPEIAINEQTQLLPYNKNYEIPKKRIQLGKLLGQGAFGSVYMATVTLKKTKKSCCIKSEDIEHPKIVAVKMLKENTDPRTFQALGSELKIMQHTGKCSYVVNLLGAVTRTIHKCELMLIIEYCKYGSLDSFLLNNRNSFINQINIETYQINLENIDRSDSIDNAFGNIFDEIQSNPYKRLLTKQKQQSENFYIGAMAQKRSKGIDFNTTDLIIWSRQIACGMSHLASLKIVHGDLAARNILLSEDFEIKISDFGLAKQMYEDEQYKQLPKKQALPIMWCSIEAIEDKKLTTQSDVWSYGIVLWELFSLGKTPYPEIEHIDLDFIYKLKNGYRLGQPQNANRSIYNIMFSCWNNNPIKRPNFNNISNIFQKYLADGIISDCNPVYFNIDDNQDKHHYTNNLNAETPFYENANSLVSKFNKKQSENYPFSVLTPTLNNYENLQLKEFNPNSYTNVNLPSYENFNAT